MINAFSHILPCRSDSQEWRGGDNRANVVGNPELIFQVTDKGTLDLCFFLAQPCITVWAQSWKVMRQDRVGPFFALWAVLSQWALMRRANFHGQDRP